MIIEQERQILNLDMLRAIPENEIYRVMDVMSTNRTNSKNEYIWDENSILVDNSDNIIKIKSKEIGRYIRRTDFDTSFSPSEVDEAVDIVINRPYFTVVSTGTVSIGNSANPSILTGLYVVTPIQGFELNASIGAVRNLTGRNIPLMLGNLALHITKMSGGSDMKLEVYSEVSPDGITWIKNPLNLRQKTFSKDAIDFWTMPSGMIDWPSNYYVRFRLFTNSSGTMNLVAPTSTVGTDNLVGLSVVWFMEERR